MKRLDILVSELCEEIDYLAQELKKAKEEAKHYRTEYNNMLTTNINHSQAMMGNLLDAILTEGVEKFMVKKEKVK